MEGSNKIQLFLKANLSCNEQILSDKLEYMQLNLVPRTQVDIHMYYFSLKQHRQNNDFFS